MGEFDANVGLLRTPSQQGVDEREHDPTGNVPNEQEPRACTDPVCGSRALFSFQSCDVSLLISDELRDAFAKDRAWDEITD